MISIIAALDSKRGIGKNGKLPWHISDDLKRFKELTNGHTIIMGRKTFESIGRPLPNRYNIVITRDAGFKIYDLRESSDFAIVSSLEEGIEKAQGIPNKSEVFIIGGGQIYKEALDKNLVNKLYLTLVEGDFGADTFFPDYSNFEVVSEEEGKFEEYKYKFVNLINK